MTTFTGKKIVRRRSVDDRYSVTDDGMVWSGVLPLEPIAGVGVNLHGKRVKIAYVVARAFVPNPEMRKYVRHKNGDRTDNRAENLEWSDEKEEGKRGRKPDVRWIKAWSQDGEVVGIWSNVPEAARETGARPEQIRACLAGKQKLAAGLLWSLA
jgi:hypothetical protein